MPVLIWGTAIVALAFSLHVAIWRVRRPARQTRALVVLFVACLVVGLGAARVWAHAGHGSPLWCPTGWAQYVHVALFVVAMMLAYVITYSAIEADSPSLVMVVAVLDAGPDGLDANDLQRVLSDDVLIRPRVRDLVRDHMVVLDRDVYRLTPKGRRFVRIFILFRALLGAPKGG